MAGHSKWHNIQHRKGLQDAKRGKLFTKIIREITVSARMGGADSAANPRLRTAIDKALGANMPRDTIDRAVKKGSGNADGDNFDEVNYEGYGPMGVAVMVDCLTDNRNRTVAEVRHAFNKQGGNLGTSGSVAYLFSKIGVLSFPRLSDADAILDAALEAGAQDVMVNDDGSVEVVTPWEILVNVKEAMIGAGFEPEQADVTMQASTSVNLDIEYALKIIKLVDVLEDLDDVQKVYTNAEFSAEVVAQL